MKREAGGALRGRVCTLLMYIASMSYVFVNLCAKLCAAEVGIADDVRHELNLTAPSRPQCLTHWYFWAKCSFHSVAMSSR